MFSFFNKNESITITGTNGKSTTCQILHDVLNKILTLDWLEILVIQFYQKKILIKKQFL